jgi:RNA polymerase sigma-70 factor (ECF subfamily)
MASSAPPPDDEVRLVLLAMAGGEAAFRVLVARHQAGVRALMRRTCGDAALADDLAQEAFLKAWLNIGKLRAPEGFAAWVRRIAVNAAIDAARRRGPATRPLEEVSADGAFDPPRPGPAARP